MTTEFSPDRLKALLEAQQITEYELASKIGYPRQMVNHWTQGAELPPIKALMSICDQFNVKIAYFFPDTVAATVPPAPYRSSPSKASTAEGLSVRKPDTKKKRLSRLAKGALASA